MKAGNIFSFIPEGIADEFLETIVQSGQVKVERIVSNGHASPEGFWYDQEEHEWVILLKGSAAIRFKGKEELVLLEPGDWVDIPAHTRHRVEWTATGKKTIWLAVHFKKQ